jgi:hypothetical protein
MDSHAQSRAPLIASIVLLVLPVLYAGSYLALIRPEPAVTATSMMSGQRETRVSNYKIGGGRLDWFFWPIEETDRQIRPGVWHQRLRGGVWFES